MPLRLSLLKKLKNSSKKDLDKKQIFYIIYQVIDN